MKGCFCFTPKRSEVDGEQVAKRPEAAQSTPSGLPVKPESHQVAPQSATRGPELGQPSQPESRPLLQQHSPQLATDHDSRHAQPVSGAQQLQERSSELALIARALQQQGSSHAEDASLEEVLALVDRDHAALKQSLDHSLRVSSPSEGVAMQQAPSSTRTRTWLAFKPASLDMSSLYLAVPRWPQSAGPRCQRF